MHRILKQIKVHILHKNNNNVHITVLTYQSEESSHCVSRTIIIEQISTGLLV